MADFCKNCGAALPAGSAFCPVCGAKRPPAARRAARESERVSENIVHCADGKYRWIYEMNLFTNLSIFLLVWKIFFFIVIGICFFVTLVDSGSPGFWWGGFWNNAKVFGYILIGMTALCALGYLLYAASMGGKYCVMFEMDEHGVNHKQMPKQAKKAELISALTVLAGAASGRVSAMGVGLNAARTEMYSDFSKTRKVKAYPRRGLIKVNGLLDHNQVYTARADFEFVRQYISDHCPNLK